VLTKTNFLNKVTTGKVIRETLKVYFSDNKTVNSNFRMYELSLTWTSNSSGNYSRWQFCVWIHVSAYCESYGDRLKPKLIYRNLLSHW